MNAKEAALKSGERAKEIAAQRKIAEARAAKEKVAEEKMRKQRFEKDIKEYRVPDALKEIEKAVNDGAKSVLIDYNFGVSYEVIDAVEKALQKLGYTTKQESRFWEADSGDRDSGEGKHDGGWKYEIRVSWKEA